MSPDRTGLVLQEKYRIVRKLGEGGMGEVYEVHHELIGKRLAIKCLHPQFARDPRSVERFMREAHTATKVRNEHIVEVFDVGLLPDGCPYILMEYLEGRELADVIELEGPLSVGRVVRIVQQVCDALNAVHAEQVVHRDLKPQNILLITRKGNPDFVKVLDFGVSKVRESADSILGSLTRTGALIGTPHYMAPEQSKGLKNTDHRADIYAVGVIMYLALVGRVPFDGETLPDLIMNIMMQTPVPPIEIRTDIPRGFNDIVLKAFHKDPNQRFSSAEELARAIEPFRDIDRYPTEADFDKPLNALGRPIVPRTSDRPITHNDDDFQSISYIRASSQRPHGAFILRLDNLRAWMIGGLTIAALLGAGAFAMLRMRSEEVGAALVALPQDDRALPANDQPSEGPAIPQALPSEPTQTPAKPAQTAGALRAEAPREVRIRLRARPELAAIIINGQEFPNPLDAHRPRSLEPVTIEVRHPGYLTQKRVALFDQDRTFTFELEPVPTRPRRQSAATTTAAPAPAPKKEPAAVSAPTSRTRELRTKF